MASLRIEPANAIESCSLSPDMIQTPAEFELEDGASMIQTSAMTTYLADANSL